jgi:hypothetical protein
VTPNERIVNSAYKVTRSELREPTDSSGNKVSGFCLAQTRIIVEDAFGWPSHFWYAVYVTDWVQPAGYNRQHGHWARDAERSLRRLGMSVPIADRMPGDLVFNWRSAFDRQWNAYVGHVGILMHGDLVLENISPVFRSGVSLLRNSTALTPLKAWPLVSTVIRFVPSDEKL